MLDSSLSIDPVLAQLTRSLALLSRRASNLELVLHHGELAQAAYDRFAAGFEGSAPDLQTRAHTAYLGAIVLARVLSCFVANDHVTHDRVVRFRQTTSRMLDLLEGFVQAPDRALRRSILADEPTGSKPSGRADRVVQ
jgi:hypothetical protein